MGFDFSGFGEWDEEYENECLSESDVVRFYNLIYAAIQGNTFEDLARNYSNDYSTIHSGGNLGIHDSLTSFVYEYKMGIYSFDAIYSGNVEQETALQSNIGFGYSASNQNSSNTIYEEVKNTGLRYVPFGALSEMYNVKDIDDHYGTLDSHPEISITEYQYPRNIYFNKYFNRRNVFVITNNSFNESSTVRQDISGDNITHSDVDLSIQEAQIGKTGFRHIDGICKDPSQMILTDEESRPIVFVVSNYGLHMFVIEKSPFDSDIKQYLTIDENYEGDCYLNFNSPDNETINQRKNELTDRIKYSIDYPYFEYQIFNYFLNKEEDIEFEFIDTSIDFIDEISSFIDNEIMNCYLNEQDRLVNEWQEYLNWIKTQEEKRTSGYLINESEIEIFFNE